MYIRKYGQRTARAASIGSPVNSASPSRQLKMTRARWIRCKSCIFSPQKSEPLKNSFISCLKIWRARFKRSTGFYPAPPLRLQACVHHPVCGPAGLRQILHVPDSVALMIFCIFVIFHRKLDSMHTGHTTTARSSFLPDAVPAAHDINSSAPMHLGGTARPVHANDTHHHHSAHHSAHAGSIDAGAFQRLIAGN